MLEGSVRVDVQSWKEGLKEGGREREREKEGEEDGVLVPAMVVCVVANTVPKHDLLHMWQKVSVII